MHSFFFQGKGNTLKNSWCSGFVSKGCADVGVLCETTTKNKACREHEKTHDLIKKRAHLTKKVLWHYESSC